MRCLGWWTQQRLTQWYVSQSIYLQENWNTFPFLFPPPPQCFPSSLWWNRKGGRKNAIIFCVVLGEGRKAGDGMQLGGAAAAVPVRYWLLTHQYHPCVVLQEKNYQQIEAWLQPHSSLSTRFTSLYIWGGLYCALLLANKAECWGFTLLVYLTCTFLIADVFSIHDVKLEPFTAPLAQPISFCVLLYSWASILWEGYT